MAIRAVRVKREGRQRDVKRKRVLLIVGTKGVHISRHEATRLFNDLKGILRKKPHKRRGRVLDIGDDLEFEGPYLPSPGDD